MPSKQYYTIRLVFPPNKRDANKVTTQKCTTAMYCMADDMIDIDNYIDL